MSVLWEINNKTLCGSCKFYYNIFKILTLVWSKIIVYSKCLHGMWSTFCGIASIRMIRHFYNFLFYLYSGSPHWIWRLSLALFWALYKIPVLEIFSCNSYGKVYQCRTSFNPFLKILIQEKTIFNFIIFLLT